MGATMRQIQNDGNAERSSTGIIAMIATETHRSFDEVKRVYDDEYARLKSDALIFDYLALFATRRTRDILAKLH